MGVVFVGKGCKKILNLPNKQKFTIINHEGLLLLEKVANSKSYKEPINFF
jgi:hypothetical protein